MCHHDKTYTCTNDKTNLRKVEVATQQHSIWPKQMKVVPDILFKISHEEMTREVIWQLITVKIGPNHCEETSIRLICFVRKKADQTRKNLGQILKVPSQLLNSDLAHASAVKGVPSKIISLSLTPISIFLKIFPIHNVPAQSF